MQIKSQYNRIPVKLSEKEFNQFVLPYLEKGSHGQPEKENIVFQNIQLYGSVASIVITI